MKYIILTRGQLAVIDDEDYELVSQYKWCAKPSWNGKTYYAYGGRGKLQMHRLIVGAIKGELVDHLDDDGLNNRRNNLRKTTTGHNTQRAQISIVSRSKTSQYRGVAFKAGKWEVVVAGTYIGRFATELEAARVYDKQAVLWYGSHAYCNFP